MHVLPINDKGGGEVSIFKSLGPSALSFLSIAQEMPLTLDVLVLIAPRIPPKRLLQVGKGASVAVAAVAVAVAALAATLRI
jgi:hypothetical protein